MDGKQRNKHDSEPHASRGKEEDLLDVISETRVLDLRLVGMNVGETGTHKE
jgi:hypothetical protein